MKNTSKFQNVVIVTIVGWLVLFVFLPNLMIIGTSFLTRDDASFVKMVFTLDNYTRLLDPLYFEVLLHSLNMALIATLACLVLGYPFAWFLAKLPHKVRPLLLFLLIVPFWTNSLIRIYGLKIFLSTKGYLNEFLLWLGVIDTPIRIMFTPSAVIIGLVYILLPFMVMPLYSSIEKLDKPLLEAARDLGASKLQTFIRIIIPLTMPGIIAGCLLVMLPAMGLFYVSDLMGGKKMTCKGVRVELDGEQIVVGIFVAVRYGCAISDVAKKVQKNVHTALEGMTGFKVAAVNVHVGGISFN